MADAGADQYTFHIEATGNKYYSQLSLKWTPLGLVLSVHPREQRVKKKGVKKGRDQL